MKELKTLKSENISNCCQAGIIENSDICSECLEHCKELTEEDLK